MEKGAESIFVPGKVTEYVFCAFFIVATVYSLTQINLGSIASLDSAEFKIGYPWSFFVLSTENPEKIPVRFFSLTIDILLYLAIAYLIEIFVKLIFKRKAKEKPEEISPAKMELYKKAKKAYDYYLKQEVSKENLEKLFKEKGWTDKDIEIMKSLKD